MLEGHPDWSFINHQSSIICDQSCLKDHRLIIHACCSRRMITDQWSFILVLDLASITSDHSSLMDHQGWYIHDLPFRWRIHQWSISNDHSGWTTSNGDSFLLHCRKKVCHLTHSTYQNENKSVIWHILPTRIVSSNFFECTSLHQTFLDVRLDVLHFFCVHALLRYLF